MIRESHVDSPRWDATRRVQIRVQNQLATAVRLVHERYDHAVNATEGTCCWHNFRGPLWMVIPDGKVLQKCCKCDATRLIHREHTYW